MYAVQQMLQLLQQLLSQTTRTTARKTKQSSDNCQTIKVNMKTNKEKDTQLLKTKTMTTSAIKHQQEKQQPARGSIFSNTSVDNFI